MEDKDRAQILLELIKTQMVRFDNTRKIQWTFNTLFWTGILITAPYLKNINHPPNRQFLIYGFCILIAYSLVMYLFQRSLDWDKNKFKAYRNNLESLIEFNGGIQENGKWVYVWIIIQIFITGMLLFGIYLFLQT